MKKQYREAQDKLLEQGWKYSHTASVRDYKPSGTVSSMRSKEGYEFCRLHIGRVVSVGSHAYQLTYVYKRES